MATTIGPIPVATPYSKRFLLTGDVAGAGLRSFTSLLNDLVEGPLKKTLQTVGAAALATLNVDGVNGDKIRLYDVAATLADASSNRALATTITWVSNADPAVAGLQATLANTELRVLEMRLNHSTQA